MFCSPTLTAEEFKQIHNALCELRGISSSLEETIHPAMLSKLQSAVGEITKGLKGAYVQDDRAYTSKTEHFEKVQEELGVSAIWSMYEVDDLNAPHPFEGAKEVVYRSHWGPKPVHVAINGLTWAALYVAADAVIRDSGDTHHIFIEHFARSGDSLILSTGS
jgi:hypothetical protein